MAGGSKLDLNNTAAGNVGALTLQSGGDWTLQLDTDGGNGSITFASVAYPGSGAFNINGWTGSTLTGGTGDRIFLSGTLGAQYTQAFLNNVQWFPEAGGGTPTYVGATVLGTGELVPVPEPTNIALAVFGAGAITMTGARRWLGSRQKPSTGGA
jgi:hypothetical protein